ncbi:MULTISPECIES: PKD domain-containing protein [Haloferax]|uniref:PKD domain-containing protein n=2 Tax=Haloferax TaxID=2251 RepID=A0A6G1Z793_9EURY|nr:MULTISPECIES: PKD domain-containing protein [Haloferax]KAB1184780.1 PKD domain-containing protein [Haloferax sp. CBA1149]MRW82412.1 PKD domain-containing protein [Haloferax marinisediminis]
MKSLHSNFPLIILLVVVLVLGVAPASTTAASAPTASFTYSPTTPNPDTKITLDASSSSTTGTEIVSYEWDTNGDGLYGYSDDARDGRTSSVTFWSGGTYVVGLRVETSDGKIDTVRKQITVENPAPDPSFTYSPSSPNPDNTISLDASASTDEDGTITDYEWDTNGDGWYGYSDDARDGQTATVSFSSGGTYTVGLQVTDNGGKTRTLTKQITVDNPAPEPSFTYSPSSPNPDNTISLDASASTDEDGTITDYEWDTNGDGWYGYSDDARDGQTATTSFSTGGVYTVGLKVTDNGGKTRTLKKQITVDNPAPEPSFTYSPSSPNPDNTISLDASASTDEDGKITDYEWDTNGDGWYGYSDDARDGQTATTSFSTGGVYTVGLKVTDNGGKTRTLKKQIRIENPQPTAKFTVESVNGLSATLDGGASSDPDGTIVEYQWVIDGRAYEYGQTPTISFSDSGTHEVKLVVTDNGGSEASTTKEVGVSHPPKAEIDGLPPVIPVDQQFELSASGSSDEDGSITSYRWVLPYGETRQGEDISMAVNRPGTSVVKLIVTDDTGNTDTAEAVIQAKTPPQIDVSWSPQNPIDDEPIEFSASSDTPIKSWEWDFDDDGYGDESGQTVETVYEEGGKKEVTLTAVGTDNLEVTIQKTIQVQDVKPHASVSWNPSVPRDGQDVVFTANSTDERLEYEWDFDNDETTDETGPKATYRFKSSGKHVVEMTATDEHGDTAEFSEVVTVQRSATFDVSTDRSAVDTGEELLVKFSGANKLPDTPIQVRLELDLPESGVSVSGVAGSNLASPSSTEFVTIDPGREQSIQLRMQLNERGSYNISGNAVYYIGEVGEGDRRVVAVEPIKIQAGVTETESSAPGFGIVGALVALVLTVAIAVTRAN